MENLLLDEQTDCIEATEEIRGIIETLDIGQFFYERDGRLYEAEPVESRSYSGGEKQKLSIFRLLLKNPDVLILDEPTSAMDTASVEAFISLIDRIKVDKIIIIVTHDARLKSTCDRTVGVSPQKVAL